ncbi:hypothetical protein AB0C69_39735 [Actinomadura sp. NPDC048032]|uniref:effector-associated constant component EACC1 n=1 Tax=Actinomadura sp. NPDC048032 TaxID=3155747 RepID=UPI0033CB565A
MPNEPTRRSTGAGPDNRHARRVPRRGPGIGRTVDHQGPHPLLVASHGSDPMFAWTEHTRPGTRHTYAGGPGHGPQDRLLQLLWRFPVEARLSLESADPIADLESLADWLRGESEFHGRVTVHSEPPEGGQLGTVPQALVVALGSGGAVSVLVATLRSWLSLPRRSSVKIKVLGKDGAEIEVDAKNIREKRVEALVDEVLNRESE